MKFFKNGSVQLGLWIGGIWLLLWVITPLWVSQSPLHQDFAAAQEQYDVPIGALYYNDIPFINEAAMEIRDTWRFLPRGPLPQKNGTLPAPSQHIQHSAP